MVLTGPQGGQEEETRPAPPADHHYVALPQTIYELTPAGEQARYLMASITLEVPIAFKDAAEARKGAFEGVFQAYLRSLSPEDLQGAAGLYDMRRGVLHRARRVLGEDAVSDVFISEILVG